MKSGTGTLRITFAAAMFLNFVSSGGAQETPSFGSGPPDTKSRPLEAEDFGTTDEGITLINYSDFFPHESGTTYASGFGISGSRWLMDASPASDPSLIATVRGIPNGATLTQISFYFDDTNGSENFTGKLCRHWVDSATGDNSSADCPVSLTSSGAPGSTILSAAPNLPIRYRYDIDSDLVPEIVNYVLFAEMASLDASLRVRAVRLRWKRNVSPAPAVATFLDVPSSHPFFQFVEALADAGLTAGCGGGNYCPDAVVTRGQMAVFLAKALGLHWPAGEGP
jgi:hypothetical protein